MSGRVKRHVLCLQMLNRTKNTKLRKAILEHADADLISALCECCTQHSKRNRTTNTSGEGAPEEIQGQTASDSEQEIVHI